MPADVRQPRPRYKWEEGYQEHWQASVELDGGLPLDAKALAKLSLLSKAGKAFFRIEDGRIVAIVRPPAAFRMDLFGDNSYIGITVLGPAHMLVESSGNELAYYRAGHIARTLADPFKITSLPILRKLIEDADPNFSQYSELALKALIRGMWFAGRGGTLAFCNSSDDPSLRQCSGYGLRHPICMQSYVLEMDASNQKEAESEYAENYEKAFEGTIESAESRKHFRDMIDDCVRMSGIDGALLFAPRMKLVRFGVKLEFDINKPQPRLYEAGEIHAETSRGERLRRKKSWAGHAIDLR